MTLSAARLRLYWETLRHLKPVQLYGRLWFRLVRPSVDPAPAPPMRGALGDWCTPARRRPSLLGPTLFRFLNESRDLSDGGWENPAAAKLWLYNLHYFDDLNAADAEDRTAWHDDLISRWIAGNPPGEGTGWEPYPTSLRIVNWIKRDRSGRPLAPAARQSLAVQVRWLERRLERHLLGNHLFANAKALVFAGCYFKGAEAERWLARGTAILKRETSEQILSDGGHFELSTMYHVLALEDLLDLVNILRSSGRQRPVDWNARIAAMRDWLAVMTHPDGEITFFNDAAMGVAPRPAEIEAYARRLGLPAPKENQVSWRVLPESGYIRMGAGPVQAWLDVARIGPDYLPGHAHADTLSFELSLNGRRALVNSGTSIYADGPARLRERGTAAHNTVMIDGKDSSEVWSSFRVARRARPVNLKVAANEVVCGHDGYRWLTGAPVHTRRWTLTEAGLALTDLIAGPHGRAEAMFHFHPDFIPETDPDGQGGAARSAMGDVLRWRVTHGASRIEETIWAPEFGLVLPSRRLVVTLASGQSGVSFSWGNA